MNSETIELPHGYKAVIEQDLSPSNPFEDWDGNPPMAVYYDSSYRHPGSAEPVTLEDLFDLIPEADFEDSEKRGKIISALQLTGDEITTAEETKDSGESWRWALRETVPAVPGYYDREDDYFDAMEALASHIGLAHYRATSRGYSQGDFAEVFLVATPAWLEETGVSEENALPALEGMFNTYTAWAWGDVYGVAELLRPDGTEVEGGACWGFIGSDHKESGLIDHCESYVESDMREQAKESERAHEAACRDIATGL